LIISDGRKISRGQRSDEVWKHRQEIIEELEELRHSSSCSSVDLQHQQLLELRQEGGERLLWLQREKLRRKAEKIDSVMREAELGKRGMLSEVYSNAVCQHLALACNKSSPTVRCLSIPLVGHYSSLAFLSHYVTMLEVTCPALSSDTFQLQASGDFTHYVPDKDLSRVEGGEEPRVHAQDFITLSRDLNQWEGSTPAKHRVWESSPQQQFHGLDSLNLCANVPLLTIAEARHVSVPRKRLILMMLSKQKV
jgi:hypothetical protein